MYVIYCITVSCTCDTSSVDKVIWPGQIKGLKQTSTPRCYIDSGEVDWFWFDDLQECSVCSLTSMLKNF